MEVIVKYNGDPSELGIEPLGQGFGVIEIERDKLEELYSQPQIENIELPKDVYINDTFTASSVCLLPAHSPDSFGLKGSGVITAVIDTGIDYTHPDFQTPNGQTRILSFWDQRGEGNPPDGFREGTEYTSEEINEALSSSDPFSVIPQLDINGHGTAVTGIAAGGGMASEDNIGMAPYSAIIAVRVGEADDDFARSTELMRAIKYVVDKARFYKMPAAINLSFGMNEGAHKGDSLFEEYISSMSSEWKTSIVIPTGNEGGAGHHYSGTIRVGETKDVEFFTASGIEKFYLSMWKNFSDDISIELILPDGSTTGIINSGSPPKTQRFRNLDVTVVYGQPTIYSVSQELFFDVRAAEGYIQAGLWRLRLRGISVVDGSFDIWLPTVEQVTTGTYFTVPDNFDTITIPSTAQKIIRVAGYNDRLGSAAEFSGIGSRNTNFPDIAAPSVAITAPRIGGGYDVFTGTSFAAPFVTGSAALMMEWGIVRGLAPFMYGERIKAYLRLGAKRSENTVYPNPISGYGMLCVGSSLTEMAKMYG